MVTRKRVLIIGMLDSVHVARWLSQFRHEPIDFLLAPSSPHRGIHPEIRNLLLHGQLATFRTIRPIWFLGAPAWVLDRLIGNYLRAMVLRRAIRKFRPHVVHALQLQNAGYLLLRTNTLTRLTELVPRVIVTNYGSDLYFYSSARRHRKKLQALMKISDWYSCECERDVQLALDLGFSGRVMPTFPNAGGFSREELIQSQVAIDNRNTIAIKGYQGWAGRAITALDGVELIANQLSDYRIELYSCNRSTIQRAKRLKRKTGLDIAWSSKGKLSHQQVMNLFRRSKIYVGVSMSDGISTSLLEAMVCGAIPVQTSTACCDEWFTETGVRVDTISPEAVAEAILTALELAKAPSNAERNRQTIREKASEEKVKAAALQYYR